MYAIPPLSLLASYTAYSFFLAYQKAYLRTLRDPETSPSRGGLFVFVIIATLYGLWFLLYWGFNVSWLQVLVLFGGALSIQLAWYLLERVLGLSDTPRLFGRLGFVAIPICGYLMWQALPATAGG